MAKRQHPRIGARIRDAMERKRMDQNQLARELGVSRSAVNSWINDRAWPQNSKAALEEILGVSLNGEPPPEPPPPRRVIPQQTKLILAATLSPEDYQRVIALLERGEDDDGHGVQAV